MGDKTKIEWTDCTFNPVIGCTKVSPGCTNCYADQQDQFRKWTSEGWGPGRPRKRTKTWDNPVKWNGNAVAFQAEHGHRQRVFCASLSDVFDSEWPADWRTDLWDLIRVCRNLDWQLLTKRPENFAAFLPWDWGSGWPHVWLGVTAENQEQADLRIPVLLRTPAVIRFVSAEPLLEPLNFRGGLYGPDWLEGWEVEPVCCGAIDPETGECCGSPDAQQLQTQKIDWIIVGGESGPNKRPFDPLWAQLILNQCSASGVAFFGKQWDKVRPLPDDLMVRQFPVSSMQIFEDRLDAEAF